MLLDALFHPRSIAVVGASQNAQKVGGMPLRLLRELGFPGRVYAINPTAAEVQGAPSYASVAELPEAVDLAIIAVPAAAVEAAVDSLIARGVRAAVVLSSGFAEVGADGEAMQARIAARAAGAGLALLGPNCLGVMNTRGRVFATFSPAPLAGQPVPGSVAIVSQSGAFGAYAYSLARNGGLGVSHWVTTGNEAVIGVADVIDWLAGDDETRVILAYIEGTRDGVTLQRALARARAAGKPVVVVKVGRTEAGARAAMSHTASLSGEDAVYQAVFDATGAVRATTIEQMFRLGQAFATGPLPRGKRLAIVTVSGGVGTLMADTASDEGLEMPPLPDAIAEQLRARIAFCSTDNPIDVTGQVTADYDAFDLTAVQAAQSGAYDAMVLFLAAAPSSPVYAPKVAGSVRLVRDAAPGFALALAGIVDGGLRRDAIDRGCMVFEEPTYAVEAIAAKARWAAGRDDAVPAQPAAVTPREPLAGLLNEVEGLAFFAAHGIAAAPHRRVASADDAVAAWRELGGEAVMKIVSRDLLHKSDVGGVRVGLRSEGEVRDAVAAIEAAVAAKAPAARREGLLVARRLRPVAEVMLGARFDPVFGAVVVVGLGGVAVELNPVSAVLVAPTTAERVRQRLEALGVLKLLGGWRGAPVVDAGPLVDTVVRFAALAAALGPALHTLEINPLMATVDGVFAADAVVEFAHPTTRGDRR